MTIYNNKILATFLSTMRHTPRLCAHLLRTNMCVGFFVALCMMWLSVLEIAPRWSGAEVMACGVSCVWAVAAVVVSCVRKVDVKGHALDVVMFLWMLYFFVNTYVSDYPCATSFLKGMWPCILYFGMRPLMSSPRLSEEMMLLLIVAFGGYEALYGYYQIVAGSNHHLYAVTGSFQNPGPYSAYLLVALTVSVAGLKYRCFAHSRRLVAVCGWLIGVLLPSTLSRAAMLAFALVMVIVFWRWCWQRRWYVVGLLLVAGVAAYLLKQGSADGRLLVWQSLLSSWQQAPWLGTGTGGLMDAFSHGMMSLYTSDMQRDFSAVDVPEYAFNDTLYILTEHGVVGLALWVAIVSLTCHALWRRSRTLLMGLLSLLGFGMFSYPLELMPFKILFVLMACWAVGQPLYEKYTLGNRLGNVFLYLVLSAISVAVALGAHNRYEKDRDIDDLRWTPRPEMLKDYYAYAPYEADDAWFLFSFGKSLSDLSRYNDSNSILRQGAKISADPMFMVVMGNNYKALGMSSEAEYCYQRAFSQMPNRLYPLYRLALLYHDTGQRSKMLAICRRIIDFNPKVPSPVIDKMKRDAKSLIRES